MVIQAVSTLLIKQQKTPVNNQIKYESEMEFESR